MSLYKSLYTSYLEAIILVTILIKDFAAYKYLRFCVLIPSLDFSGVSEGF